MMLVADRHPVASGITSMMDPPPDLPNVDEAQRFYLFGRHGHSAAPLRRATSARVYYFESGLSGLWQLRKRIADELTQLLQLRAGWDGHRAKAITLEAVYATALVMDRVLEEGSEAPQVFPLPSGGIQVEWYAEDDEIEIEVDSTGEAHVLATTAGGEIAAEGTFDPQVPSELAGNVADLVKNLSVRATMGRQHS